MKLFSTLNWLQICKKMQIKWNDFSRIKYNYLLFTYLLSHFLVLLKILWNRRHFLFKFAEYWQQPLHTEHMTVYDFSSRECPLLFDQICGQQTAPTSTWPTTRSSSSKFVIHGCITSSMNWKRTDYAYGVTLTTASFTVHWHMALIPSVFKHVYRQTDT